MFKFLRRSFRPQRKEKIKTTMPIVVKKVVNEIPFNIQKIVPKKYELNEQAFTDFRATLRNHQVEALKALDGKNVGQVNIPTGTGKTYIQKAIHIEDMIAKTKENKTGVYVIAAHRLILCSQLFKEIIDLMIRCGLKTDLLYIGSGHYPFEQLNYDYRNMGFERDYIRDTQTTNKDIALDAVNKAIKSGHHLLIVATYHSFDCLVDFNKIDICTFDEAHSTVEARFTENIGKVINKIDRKYFFTATRRVVGKDGGQANEAFYGPVLYEMSPRAAVELGEIVSPRIHIVEIGYKDDVLISEKDVGMLVKTVTSSFIKHEAKIKEYSAYPNEIAGKLLVTSSGLDEIKNIMEDSNFISWCKEMCIKPFAFSSHPGETSYDFIEESSREKMLEKMNNLESNDRTILFHYDILTEGIDLPAITGVMLLRSTIPEGKLIQNLGRACRLHPIDRIRLYKGNINIGDHSSMIKPFSWVVLPTYINSNWHHVRDIIINMRNSYDVIETHVEFSDTGSKPPPTPPIPVTTEQMLLNSKNKEELKHIFEDIEIAEFYDGLYNTTNQEQYIMDYIS